MHYLVRHGDAGNKREWTGPDHARPLSRRGRFEADALVDLLATFTIDRILSSPALRCRQTVEPLAGKRGMTVVSEPLLAVEADPGRAVEVLLAGGDDVVWCTHGELIRPLLSGLRDRGAPISEAAAWPKGSVWVLETNSARIAKATYLPPPVDR
ncbi:MAG: histidine phosphatase family protein [Kitasatospora sp.]|nr:histidine phosphatase family protein [Kitasatospora sp.]